MDEIIRLLTPWLFGAFGPFALLVLLLFVPEKIEKWSALLWKLLSLFGNIFRSAHRQYVKHDLQGRVNDFAKRLRRDVSRMPEEKLRVEWIDPTVTRESFIADGQVVLRLRRDDPQDHNFVHGAYLYVSATLLRKAKRYLSLSQRHAIDLFVCTKLIESEKSSVVGFFLDEYLHPKTAGSGSKIAAYLDDFAIIDDGKLYFPVFMQELHFLGDKVFGRRKDDLVIKEVRGLINFLKPIATRRIGEEGDLHFDGEYCRFGLVIIGKPKKLLESIEPYVHYINKELVQKDVETIYLLSRKENRRYLEEIFQQFSESYNAERRFSFRRKLKYEDFEEIADQYLMVLRKKDIEIIQASST